MSNKLLWSALLAVSLLLMGTDIAKAVEYGELVQKDGKWEFKDTEDPVFKYMHDHGWVTHDGYFKLMDQTGKNWVEPADAVLNRRREIDGASLAGLDRSRSRKSDQI
jgi:hypothetical protein